MIHNRSRSANFVFAVFPSAKGFGYAVFEGPRTLIDWGVRGASGAQKNRESLQKMRELLDFYRPDVVVLEDYDGHGSRRARRIEILINLIAAHAHGEGMRTASYSRTEVRACFGLTAKREIAEAIVREFPELEPRLPPVRKIWMSEDRRMNIFDAVALAITFFNSESPTKRRPEFHAPPPHSGAPGPRCSRNVEERSAGTRTSDTRGAARSRSREA